MSAKGSVNGLGHVGPFDVRMEVWRYVASNNADIVQFALVLPASSLCSCMFLNYHTQVNLLSPLFLLGISLLVNVEHDGRT